MSHPYDQWLDDIAAGKPPTIESFARLAGLGDLPRVTTQPRKLDPSKWPAGSLEEKPE